MCFSAGFLAKSNYGTTTQPGLRRSGGTTDGEDATGESAQRPTPYSQTGPADRLAIFRRAFRGVLQQRREGTTGDLHEADGLLALPQIHPRPLRRGGGEGMG